MAVSELASPREYTNGRQPFNNPEYITETLLIKSKIYLEILAFFLKSSFIVKLGI